ncbi:protease complex subunit PrcB family protein [Desulfobotulus sp. H1]|uniref:Protease complex subunit PrcB family protein n=1 Tax=Desulfobotulus pelophilus TaxID=2823377 RepID=A0ABT3NBV5_9BACT|nr:protease complex subunit PrcB family protein [Desulfobotulus pelophilus]MCW7754938.1 protease complex subunit PrcB family protein [Desulfobotulus pelophilus]
MKQKPWRALGGILVISLLVSGCFSGTKTMGAPPVVNVLYHGSNCGFYSDEPFGVWIGSPEDMGALHESHGQICADAAFRLDNVDFTEKGVLLLGLGRKNTGGYGIRLTSTEFETVGDTAILRIRLLRPSPGSPVTQVFTWPCILIEIPRTGHRHVQAMDDAGHFMMKTRMDY